MLPIGVTPFLIRSSVSISNEVDVANNRPRSLLSEGPRSVSRATFKLNNFSKGSLGPEKNRSMELREFRRTWREETRSRFGLETGIAFGLFFLNKTNARRLSTTGLFALGLGTVAGAVLLIQNIREGLQGVPIRVSEGREDGPLPNKLPIVSSPTKQEKQTAKVQPKRVIICSMNLLKRTFVVSYQGGEPFEVSSDNMTWRLMTLKDWNELFLDIPPPSDGVSRILKYTFDRGRYYSYVGEEGSYIETLNEVSCPFGKWAEQTPPTPEPELPAVRHYDDLVSFLDRRKVNHADGDTEDGGKSVAIGVEQEWTDGMIPDKNPRIAVNTATYLFNEEDEFVGLELYLWAPRLLDFVNDDLPDSSLILTQGDLENLSIAAVCPEPHNCSMIGLPEGIVGGYWSQAIYRLVDQYMNLENLY